MSDLLNSASLVMIPSGYKEDIVYSAVPTDGSGDLSFTRSSNGTRINSAGLVEVTPWNLVTYSEDLTNGAWQLASATIGANATTAPNGTTTAESFTSSVTLANHVVYQLLGYTGGSYTYSVYVKKANSRYVYIKLVGDASQWVAAVFDLNDGTLTKSEATGWTGLTASSESVGNGWYRLIVSGSGATSVNFNVGIQYTNTATPSFSAYADASFTGTGTIDYYIWGAQLNIGATAKPYFPTTDRLNVPRLTYQNGCPSLLLEKQSTNLVLYSEQFDNVGWSLSGVTVSANQTTSPDGTQNADKLIESSANVLHEIYQAQSLTNGVTYTNTIYAKSAERTQIAINFVSGGFGQGANVIADLSAGTLGTVSNYGSVTGSTATITNVGNGWYRISLTMTPATTTTFYADYSPALNGNITYQGNGTSGVFIWGAQIEQSTYPTSYINTTSASATRVKDLAYNTSATSLIGQSEGVLFCDFNLPSIESDVDYPFIVDLFGSTGYRFGFARYPNGGVHIYMQNNFSAQFTYNTTQLTGRFKLALGYKANDCVIYLNGTLLQTITSATIPATSGIAFNAIDNNGAYNSQSQINQCVLFKTRLTNAELASLTTL